MADQGLIIKSNILALLFFYLAPHLNGQECGENVVATPQDTTLTSPGYPRNYENNMDCVYRITAPEGGRVYLTTSTIDGVRIEESEFCSKDYILVIDGPSSTGQVLTRTCDYRIAVMSTGREMTLLFHTDGDTTARGFRLLYRSINNTDECPVQSLPAYNADSAVISPFFPMNYPNNTECEWRITAPPEHVVYIEVEQSSLEYSEQCEKDYVQVFDAAWKNGGWTIGDKLCGSYQPNPRHSTGIFMTIVFHSDAQISDQGFRIVYSARPKSEFPDPPETNSRNLVVGVVTAVIVVIVILVILGVTCFLRARKRRSDIIY